MLKEEFNRILNNKKIEDKNITREYEAYNKGIEDAQKVFNMLIAIEETKTRSNNKQTYIDRIDKMDREEEIDHKIKEWIHNTTQKDITFQEAYIELPIEDQLDNLKRINYLNLIWLKEKMYKEAIEETRKNILREYPDPEHSPEDILINMEDIYYRERTKQWLKRNRRTKRKGEY